MSCLLQTFCHLITNENLFVSWRFFETYGRINYGSVWRKDVANQCLQFGLSVNIMLIINLACGWEGPVRFCSSCKSCVSKLLMPPCDSWIWLVLCTHTQKVLCQNKVFGLKFVVFSFCLSCYWILCVLTCLWWKWNVCVCVCVCACVCVRHWNCLWKKKL